MAEKELNESQLRVLLTLEDEGELTYDELSEKSGLSYDGVRGRVSELVQKGYNIVRKREGTKTLLAYEKDKAEERELKRPHTYGDVLGRRTKNMDDFMGMTDFLNGLRRAIPKKRKKLAINNNTKEGFLLLSDLHFGNICKEDGEITYDTEEAKRRLEELAYETIKVLKSNDIDFLHIGMLGDIVEGDAVYKNQAFDIEKSAIEQVKDSVEALSNFIRTIKSHNISILVSCVRGNHGLTNYKNLEQDNWDNVVYDMLNLVFATDDDVVIDHYADREVKVSVLDKQVVLTHGEDIPEQIRTSSGAKVFRGMCTKHNLQPGDMIVAGHLHTFSFDTDQKRMFVRNGAMVNSTDYALRMQLFNTPMQTLMIVEEGLMYPTIVPIEFYG